MYHHYYTLTLSDYISHYEVASPHSSFATLSPFFSHHSHSDDKLDLMDDPTTTTTPFTAYPDLSRYDPQKIQTGQYRLPERMARTLSASDQKRVEDLYYRALAAREAAGGRDPQAALLGIPEHRQAFMAGKIPLEKMLQAARVLDAEQRGEMSRTSATRTLARLGVPQQVSTIGGQPSPSQQSGGSPLVTQEQRRREIEASRTTTLALYEKTVARVKQQVIQRVTTSGAASTSSYTTQQRATIERLAQTLVEQKLGFMKSLSDEQARAVVDPARAVMLQAGGGAGKSATIAARLVHDVVNNGVDASQVSILGPTHSTKDALTGLLTKLESILPGFDLSGRNAPRTLHSLAYSYLNAPLRDEQGHPLVGDDGQPLRPISTMQQGALRDYRPIGIASRQFKNAEQARDAMQSSQKVYFEKVLQQYALRGKVPQVDDVFNKIQQIKTSAARSSDLYTQTVKKGREDWNAGRRTTQEALFYAYESHLKNRPGFSTPGQSRPYYDLADTITLAANAASEAGSRRAPYLVLDEFQDASPESLRMLANMMDPHTRIMLAGDMGQKTIKSGLRVDQLAHEILGRRVGSGGISEHQLTGNYRSGPWTVAMMRAMQGEPILEGRSGSPPQISLRSAMDLPPTFGVGRTFKETYEGMISDMVRQLGLSMESIGENIKMGQHPLTGSTMVPQQAPALMQMRAQRDLFRQTLEGMLGQQVGAVRAKGAMEQMYSESTPTSGGGNPNALHALLEGQARSRMFEHPFIDTTRVGSKWSDADYLEALQTMVGRTGTQMHLYQSMQNITGSNYALTPGTFLGQAVPQNFDRWTQQAIDHLQQVYGLSDMQIAPQLQQALQIPIRAASQASTEDPAAIGRYFQDLIDTSTYYQPAVNSGVGGAYSELEAGVRFDNDSSEEEGGRSLLGGMRDKGVFNRAVISGQYKRGPDTKGIQFGVEALRALLQQGAQYQGSSIPSSLQEVLSSPMFSHYRKDERIESPYAANQRLLSQVQQVVSQSGRYMLSPISGQRGVGLHQPMLPGMMWSLLGDQSGQSRIPVEDIAARMYLPASGENSRILSSPRGDDFQEIRELGRDRAHLPTGKRGFSALSQGYMYKGKDVESFQSQLFDFMRTPAVWGLPGMREALATKHDDPKLVQHALTMDSVRGKGAIARQAESLVALRHGSLGENSVTRAQSLYQRGLQRYAYKQPNGGAMVYDPTRVHRLAFLKAYAEADAQHKAFAQSQSIPQAQRTYRDVSRTTIPDMIKQEMLGGNRTSRLHNALMTKAAQLLSFSSSLPKGMLHQIADAAESMADLSSEDPDTYHRYSSFAEAVRTRAGRDITHADDQGLTMSEEELAWVHRNRPEEGALLERMLRGSDGKLRNFEHPQVKGQIAQLTHARGTQARYMSSSDQASQLGISLANSRMAPYQTELASLGDRMIIDPQAVQAISQHSLSKETLATLDAQFPKRTEAIQAELRARQTIFQSLGAGVTLPTFQQRMQDMLGGKSKLSHRQRELAYEHLRAMKGMRSTLNNPDWQRYGGHFLNVVGWAAMGKGPIDPTLTEAKRAALRASGQHETDPMDFLFRNQRQDYKEGTRTFAAMQEFVSALNEGITHLHTTGTIKRGHIDRILTALGHDTGSPEFAPLHMMPDFGSPDATLPVGQVARQYPRDVNNLLGQMTRMPFRPGEDAIYMGGVPGFTDPSIAHTQVGLAAGTRGYLAPYAPGEQFGLSKFLGIYRKPEYRLLTQGEFNGGIPMSVPGNTPMEPVYRMVVPGLGPDASDTVHYVRHSQLAGLGWMGQTPSSPEGEGGGSPSSPSSHTGLIGALAAAGASVSPLVMSALPHISSAFHGLMSHPAVSALLTHPALPSMMLHPASLLPHLATMAMVGAAGAGGSSGPTLVDVATATRRGNKDLGIHPPSDEQLAFMTAPEKARVIEGGPGAGKTGTLARTIAHLIAQRKTLPQNVLTLTALRSAVSKFNEGLDPYRALFPGHGREKAYQIPAPITYHSLGTQTIFGNAFQDEDGTNVYPMLQKMGLGHLTGQILSNPSQDDLLGMNPQEQKRALQESQSAYIRGMVSQHTSEPLGDYQLDDFVKHISEVKKNRHGLNSTYNDSLRLGQQALREGRMNKHAALALYEHTKDQAGIIDQDDVPFIAANMYEQLGAAAVPARYQGTQIVGMDEGQDQNYEVARMMKGFLGGIAGNDPHTLVGLDLMQSLTQGMGGTPVRQVRGLYRDMLGLPGGDEPFHQLTRNFRSSIGDIAMNNAILSHPSLRNEPKSPFQVPGTPGQRVGVFPAILTAKSQPLLYQQMFTSQLGKAGLSPSAIVSNVQAGRHPLAGATTSPSQIPAIFSRNQDEKLFQHVAKQMLVAEGLSRKQVEHAWSQMYRSGTPSVNATDIQKQQAQQQFWGLTHRGARAWDWLFPHIDATQFKGWDTTGNIRNMFVGGSRPQQEGQNTFGAASHPFTAAQYRQYVGGADFEDTGMVDRGEVLLGGKAIRQSPLNTFERFGASFVPAHFAEFLTDRAHRMIQMGVDPHDPAITGGLLPPAPTTTPAPPPPPSPSSPPMPPPPPSLPPVRWGRQVPPAALSAGGGRRPVPPVSPIPPGGWGSSSTTVSSQRRPPPIPAPKAQSAAISSSFPAFDDPMGVPGLTADYIRRVHASFSPDEQQRALAYPQSVYKSFITDDRGMNATDSQFIDLHLPGAANQLQRSMQQGRKSILEDKENIAFNPGSLGFRKQFLSSLGHLQALSHLYQQNFGNGTSSPAPLPAGHMTYDQFLNKWSAQGAPQGPIKASQVNVQITQGQVNVNPAQGVPIASTGLATSSSGGRGGQSIALGPAFPSSGSGSGGGLPPIPPPGQRAGLGGGMPLPPFANNGGSGIGTGGGAPPATITAPGGGNGGGPPPNNYGLWNNAASNMGRSLTRIGNEMQFIGKAISQSVDQSVSQGSQYRRATFGLPGSGPTGTEGFYDPRITAGTLNGSANTITSFQNAFLPMYSKTQIAQGYQGLTGLANNTNIGLGALTATMGMSALAGVDPSQLMQSMAQISGLSGQAGRSGSYGNLTGMLYQMYGNNASQANISPTLQALGNVMPSLQGLSPASRTQAAQAMALFQTALGSGMSPANLPDVAQTLGSLSQLGSNPDLQQQYALQQSGYHLTSDVQLAQFQQEQVGRAEQIAQLQLQQNIGGGLSLPQLNIQIDQAQIRMDKAQLDMSGLQLGAAQIAQQGNVLQVGMAQLQQQGAVLDYQHALASYQFNLGVQNALYGPIGADRSRLSGYSFQNNQLYARRDPLNSQAGVLFSPSNVSGLRNQEFYAGLQNQQQSLILGRSPLLSDALFQQQMKYIKEQADFYQKELAITNAQRAFEKDWTARLLEQQKKVVDYNAKLVAQQERAVAYNAKLVAEQGYIYGLQQQQYKLEVEKNLYDQKVQKITQSFLGQQVAALQNVQGALNQFITGQGPINGGTLQPMDLIQTLAKQFKNQPDSALINRTRQLLPGDLADQNILFKLVKTTEQDPTKLAAAFQKFSQADQSQFMAAFGKAVKNGNFTDQVQARTSQDQALAYAGVGTDWKHVASSINSLATVMPQIAQDFAWMSGLAPWAGMIISYAGTAMVVMGTVLNALGLVQALARFFGVGGTGGGMFARILGGLGGGGGAGGAGGLASGIGDFLTAALPIAIPLIIAGLVTYAGIDIGQNLNNAQANGTLAKQSAQIQKNIGNTPFLSWLNPLNDNLKKFVSWLAGDAPNTASVPVTDRQMNARYRDQGGPTSNSHIVVDTYNPPSASTIQAVKDGALIDQSKTQTQRLVDLYKQTVTHKPVLDQISKSTLDTSKATIQNDVNAYKRHMQALDQQNKQHANLISQQQQQHNEQVKTIKDNINTTGHGFAVMKTTGDTTNKTVFDSKVILHDSKDLQQKILTADQSTAKSTGDAAKAASATPPWLAHLINVNSGGGQAGPASVPMNHPGFLTPHVNKEFHAKMNYGIHQGVDFQASQGTPLREFTGGKVLHTGFFPWGGEVDVGIPGTPFIERYLHLSLIGVTPGQNLKRNQFIGLTGGGTPASGLGYWSSGAHSHVQIDTGNINAGVNPWPLWALFGDNDIAQYYGGPSGPGATSKLSMGGIAMRPTKADLGDGGEPEAVIPLSKLSMVMSSIPQRGGHSSSSFSSHSPFQKSITISKLTDKVEVHLHLSSATMSDQEKDALMAQTLEVLGQAVEHFAGKLT